MLLGPALCDQMSTTQTLSAQVDPYGTVAAPASVALTHAGTTFANYRANVTLNYRARTSAVTGSGSITLQAVSDFTPSGGPTTTTGALLFTCGAASLGQACSGSQSLSTTSASTVLTLPAGACTGGGGACSSADPNSIPLQFDLTNKPNYKTGLYTLQLTFTVSSF